MTSSIRKYTARMLAPVLAVGLLLQAAPISAKDNLGVYSDWGAFRDPQTPRCYAIALARPDNRPHDYQPYAAVGTWPRQGLRNQLHFRLSRKLAPNASISLSVGRNLRVVLTGGGGDAWAQDKRMEIGRAHV